MKNDTWMGMISKSINVTPKEIHLTLQSIKMNYMCCLQKQGVCCWTITRGCVRATTAGWAIGWNDGTWKRPPSAIRCQQYHWVAPRVVTYLAAETGPWSTLQLTKTRAALPLCRRVAPPPCGHICLHFSRSCSPLIYVCQKVKNISVTWYHHRSIKGLHNLGCTEHSIRACVQNR